MKPLPGLLTLAVPLLGAACTGPVRAHDGPPRPEHRTAFVVLDDAVAEVAHVTHVDGRPVDGGARWVLAPGWRVVTLERRDGEVPVDLGAVFRAGETYRIVPEATDGDGEPALRIQADLDRTPVRSNAPQLEDLRLPSYPADAPSWPVARWYRTGERDVAVHRPDGALHSAWTRRLVRTSMHGGVLRDYLDEVEEAGGAARAREVGQGSWLVTWTRPDSGGTLSGLSAVQQAGGDLHSTSFQTRHPAGAGDPQFGRWQRALGAILAPR